MTYRWYGLAVILSVLPLAAGTIDVSTHASAWLDTDDQLSFTVPSWNFSINAANFRLPEYPTSVGFLFVSASEDSLAQVEAILESGDGSVSVSFGVPLSFVPAMFQGSRYSGAVLILLNSGPALTVGLPPYTLKQDLNVSLGGGGLSVGAPLGGVAQLEASDPSGVPEPGAGLLLLGGGALLGALSRLRSS